MPARFETYVDELRQELRDLPVASRAQELAEVRTHLEDLKAANVELGLSEEEAESAAVSQFGGSRAVGKAVKKSCWREQLDTVFGVAWLSGLLCWLPTLMLLHRDGTMDTPKNGISLCGYGLSSLFLGMILYKIAPRFGVRGTLLAFVTTVVSEILFWLFSNHHWGFTPLFWYPRFIFFLGVIAASGISHSKVGRRGLV